MLCTDCSKSFERRDFRGQLSLELEGLCNECGTQPKFEELSKSFGRGSLLSFLSGELILVLGVLAGWVWYLLAGALLLALHLALKFLASRSGTVYYVNSREREHGLLGQRLAGGIASFAIAMSLLFAVIYLVE